MNATLPEKLSGRYRLGELIGRGGHADVHAAYDEQVGRGVAVKILSEESSRKPKLHRRFLDEVSAVSRMESRYVVAVYDQGILPADESAGLGERPFMVMEQVSGTDLRQAMAAERFSDAALVRITAQVLEGLGHVHSRGFVHRDIKPANILLTAEGEPRIGDFGIAKALGEDGRTVVCDSMTILGTAAYISPEQAQGLPLDPRTDVYSAAGVLFEALAGRTPFEGGSPVTVASKKVNEPAPPLASLRPDLPQELSDAIAYALATEPEDRYATAAEFREDLLRCLELMGTELSRSEESGSVPAPLIAPPLDDPSPEDDALLPDAFPAPAARTRNRRAALGAFGLLTAAVVGGGGAYVYAHRDTAGPDRSGSMPSLPERSWTDAEKALKEQGIKYTVSRESSTTAAKDSVLRTYPAAGSPVDSRTTVEVVVSDGDGTTTMPQLKGLTRAEAEKKLKEAHLAAGHVVQKDSRTVPKGSVVDFDPPAGTAVAAGTIVSLSVSTGKVTMPNLVGLTRAEAEEALSAPSLKLEHKTTVREPAAAYNRGRVMTQEPAAGTSVAPDTVVRIAVGKGDPIKPKNSLLPRFSSSDPKPSSSPTSSPTTTKKD